MTGLKAEVSANSWHKASSQQTHASLYVCQPTVFKHGGSEASKDGR